jgi:hypothetical protein
MLAPVPLERSLAMIALIVALGMSGAAPAAPAAPTMPRKNLGMCFNKVVEAKIGDKLAPDAFKAAAAAACTNEENAFRNAWIAYEVGMKTKRTDAEQNANSQIDDYLQNAVETYTESVKPPKS